ncbi:helix-turn-helix domain-containing protein [Nocardia gipuzkoensis]
MGVGELIRELRKARGWSQGRLADELSAHPGASISREYISRRWENGDTVPSRFWLRHLSAVLDVPLAVFEDDGMKRRKFLAQVAATSIAPVVASDLLAAGFSARLDHAGPNIEAWQAKLSAYGTDYCHWVRRTSNVVSLSTWRSCNSSWTVRRCGERPPG